MLGSGYAHQPYPSLLQKSHIDEWVSVNPTPNQGSGVFWKPSVILAALKYIPCQSIYVSLLSGTELCSRLPVFIVKLGKGAFLCVSLTTQVLIWVPCSVILVPGKKLSPLRHSLYNSHILGSFRLCKRLEGNILLCFFHCLQLPSCLSTNSH